MSQPLDWLVGYYTSMLWQGNFDEAADIEAMLRDLIKEAQSPFNVEKARIGKA